MASSETDIRAVVDAALAANDSAPDRLIEVLHGVQAALGHVPAAAVPPIAAALNLSRAEVQGVIGFYHDFRQAPAGQAIIQVCRAEACQAMGVEALETHIRERLGVDWHETSKDGRYTLEPVYCLGNCACTPSVRIGDDIYAKVTPERFDAILAEREQGA